MLDALAISFMVGGVVLLMPSPLHSIGGAAAIVTASRWQPETIADAVCALLERETESARCSEAASARTVSEFRYEHRHDALRTVINQALAEGR